MPDNVSKFLNLISGRWEDSIPLKTLWMINFDNLDTVLSNVYDILGNTERTNSSVIKFPVDQFSDSAGLSIPRHTLLAQKIITPGDNIVGSYTGNNNMGGLYGGYYVSHRENFQNVTVSFLETNKDIFDFIIKPWVIATSYMGLIEDTNNVIKTNLNLTVYGKDTPEDWRIRKKYIFEGVAPVTSPADSLDYDKDYTLVRDVNFTYKRYYTVSVDPTSNTLV